MLSCPIPVMRSRRDAPVMAAKVFPVCRTAVELQRKGRGAGGLAGWRTEAASAAMGELGETHSAVPTLPRAQKPPGHSVIDKRVPDSRSPTLQDQDGRSLCCDPSGDARQSSAT